MSPMTKRGESLVRREKRMNSTPDNLPATIEESPPQILDSATLSVIERAQIDTQIATARAYPRSVRTAINNILTLATLDEQTAVECVYVLSRGKKPVRGPSVRLAEIVAQK